MSRAAPPRLDWERRVGLRSDAAVAAGAADLLPPTGLLTETGGGQVTVWWDPVDGAAGYVVSRAEEPSGPFAPLDHGGSDVLAVPAPPYADTSVVVGETYWYTVAAVAGAELAPGPAAGPVVAAPFAGAAGQVTVDVDAARVAGRLDRVWRLVGSERLSQLGEGEDAFGNDIGAEFGVALARARDELGVEMVRAHAIFHDDVGVLTLHDGLLRFDFRGVDRIFDELVGLALRPVVELSFMPRDLASDPHATVFEYRGIISPPHDWTIWGELNARLAEHLVDRYGIEEVARWGFEVWNEPNLAVFWTGTQAEYFRLYAEAANAIKAVDPRLRVGGPSTAASEWLEDFADFAASTGTPVDFVSTHTYGNVPLDVGPTLRRHGLDAEVWWTEWGAGATHFGPIHDEPYGAPFVLRGVKAVQGRVDALAYWVVSDHFEELGRPQRLFHNGFGLLTVGNLRKPRWWALRLATELGDDLLETRVEGDGAESLVDAWAARRDDGTVDVLVWNGALNAAKFRGDPALDRDVSVRIAGLDARRYEVDLARIDATHSNVSARFPADRDWPDEKEWERLRREDELYERRLDTVSPRRGEAGYELPLPMPGVARLRLTPVPAGPGAQPTRRNAR